jgi:cell division protein ZapA
MSSLVRTTSVLILGREYKVRTTEDEDFVHEVAEYVDTLMNRISTKMASGTASQIAVLAALNIAEELFRAKRNGFPSAPAEDEVEGRLRALSSRLSEMLDGAESAKTRTKGAPARTAVTA